MKLQNHKMKKDDVYILRRPFSLSSVCPEKKMNDFTVSFIVCFLVIALIRSLMSSDF